MEIRSKRADKNWGRHAFLEIDDETVAVAKLENCTTRIIEKIISY